MNEIGVDIYPDPETKPKIGVVGYGVVGETITQTFMRKGYSVYVNDIKFDDESKRFDKQLPCVVQTLDYLVQECGVIFICVPTPTNERGCDLSIVYEVFNDLHYRIAQRSREGAIDLPVIAIKSTVIPGTTDSLYKMYPRVCSNPEFMRELTATDDFLHPDRIVIGTHSEAVKKSMQELYSGWEAPIFITTPVEAEMAKYLSNAFLVTKVAFSQEAKHICEMVGANVSKVMNIVITDSRINPSHLDPLPGKIPKDNTCLPKDFMALLKQLELSGDAPIMLQAIYVMGVEGARLSPSFKIKEEAEW